MKTHRVLNRLSKCANARYRKNQVFLWFTVNSQSKLKRHSVHYSSNLLDTQGFMVGSSNW